MEKDSKGYVGKTEDIDFKQQVIEWYPTAHLIYVPIRKDRNHYLIKIADFDILSMAETPLDAWEGAWRCAQVRFLKKLEY